MEDRCPKCGTTLTTRTIKKQLGSGSIDYPVAQVCPKCNWSRDLTGAGDISSKPLIIEGGVVKENVINMRQTAAEDSEPPEESRIDGEETEEEKPSIMAPASVKKQPASLPLPANTNTIITAVMAILVLAGIIWAFYPTAQGPSVKAPIPTPTPTVTATPVTTATVVAEVTPTGNKTWVRLDRYRIFRGATSKIKPGDEVVWANDGIDSLTLLSDNIPDFGTRMLDNGKQTSYIFKKPGTYSFYLKDNKNVNGTIIVKP